jgi:hypothetical protein
MTVDTLTGYTFDAGYTFGAHCISSNYFMRVGMFAQSLSFIQFIH